MTSRTFRKPWLLVTIALALFVAPMRADEPKPKSFDTPPKNAADLKAVQDQVKKMLDKIVPATVGLRIGGASGSGVIIKDNYILTAGHVSGKADREVTIILHDGKKIKGKTLGANYNIDSGLIKITEEGNYPFVERGKSEDLKKNQWCIAIGHPGGYKTGRSPVVRVGRVLQNNKQGIQTDCTLVGGDSGGPLFDLDGKVIGINSRIGGTIVANVHVPVDTFDDTWDRLAKGETWGGRSPTYLGIQLDPEAKDCKIAQVQPNSPAAKAGIKADDIVTKLNDDKIENGNDLAKALQKKKPGDKIKVEVNRDGESQTIEVTLGKREGQ